MYLREWLTVYTSKAKGQEGSDECEDVFVTRYQGRVREEDWHCEPVSHVAPDAWEWRLMLKLPNLRGAFRSHDDAEQLAGELGPDAIVVLRFSDHEKQLLAYGRRLLHDGH